MKFFLVAVISFLLGPLIQAQVLYNEGFETYTLGNLGTDPTGKIPGQGGWLTQMGTIGTINNNAFAIVNDPVKNKVLQLGLDAAKADTTARATAYKPLNVLIDNRAPGNNVIKFEIDYYTGATHTSQFASNGFTLNYESTPYNKILFSIVVNGVTGIVTTSLHNGQLYKLVFLNNKINGVNPVLPFNTWITFIVYLDYNNKKAYFETPYFNTVAKADFLETSTSLNLLNDFKPFQLSFYVSNNGLTGNQQIIRKYDSIKITALNAVPPHILNAESFLAEKFNLYPNPATNVVNITNNENMLVQQVTVYDIVGKQLSTQTFNNQAEIQLNVESLSNGTYMLHIQTNEGMAVKKLVKK
nr:T9SS type A sorting domain-containing protein [uncultured Flavobacterium sp.]